MKLICTADWQLAAQGGRIDPETGLNNALIDRYGCARFCVEDGIRRGGQLVLVAGDVFNSPKPTPTDVRRCRDALGAALEAGVPVVLETGNHDCPKSEAEKHALDLLRDTPGVTVVDQPQRLTAWGIGAEHGYVKIAPTDPCPDDRKPMLQISCLPWPNRQLLLADADFRRLNAGQLEELVRDKMMDIMRGLAAELIDGVPSVLLGHFSVDVAEAGGMRRLMALGADFVLNLHDITGLGFGAAILGHVHKPQELSTDPLVAYTGSPECITQGEAGEEKRYLILDTETMTTESIPTPYRRHITLEVQNGVPLPIGPELEGAVVRVNIPAGMGADAMGIRAEIEAAGAYECSVSVERAETLRRRDVDVSAGMPVDAALKAWLTENPEFVPMADELVAEAQALEAILAGGDA